METQPQQATIDWSQQEQRIVAQIMVSETMHDPECRGCGSCDDASTRESCHRLCSRSEAIRRMQRRTKNGAYLVRESERLIYKRELRRWPKSVLASRRIEFGLAAAS